MKTKFSIFMDVLFSAFLSFVLYFILLNYYIERPYSIVIALALCVITATICLKMQTNKRIKSDLSKAEKMAEKIMTEQLNLMPAGEQTKLLEKAFEKKGIKTKASENNLLIPEKNISVFINFSFDKITRTQIVNAFNHSPDKYTIYFLSGEFDNDIEEFCSMFNGRIILVGKEKVYKFLSENDMLPHSRIVFLPEKKFPSGLFYAFFNRKHARSYGLAGLLFVAMSYFVPFKAYYIIFGCLLIVFSVISLIFGKREKQS